MNLLFFHRSMTEKIFWTQTRKQGYKQTNKQSNNLCLLLDHLISPQQRQFGEPFSHSELWFAGRMIRSSAAIYRTRGRREQKPRQQELNHVRVINYVDGFGTNLKIGNRSGTTSNYFSIFDDTSYHSFATQDVKQKNTLLCATKHHNQMNTSSRN